MQFPRPISFHLASGESAETARVRCKGGPMGFSVRSEGTEGGWSDRGVKGARAYAKIQSDRRNKRNNSAYEHANFAPRNLVGSVWHGLSLSILCTELFKLSYLCQSCSPAFLSCTPSPPLSPAPLVFQPFQRHLQPTATLSLMANDYCRPARLQVSG